MDEELDLAQFTPDGGTERLTLTTYTLGLEPYVLIRMVPDPDAPPVPMLSLRAGGGAGEHPLYLPLLVLTEHPAEGNILAEALQRLYASDPALRPGVLAVVRELNNQWLSFVTDGSVTS